MAQVFTSAAIESHMYFFFMIFTVVLLDGWARPCTMSKTVLLIDGGIHGRGVSWLVSHSMEGPSGSLINCR